jgi:predicted dehydrogenase
MAHNLSSKRNHNSPKIGIIGAGNIARHHMEAAKASGLELEAICGLPNSVRAKTLGDEFGVKNICQDINQLLNSKLDAVIVCSSTESQIEVLMALRDLNLPVLVEKPVALSSEPIIDLHPSLNSKVMVGFNRRFYSSTQEMKKNLDRSRGVYFSCNIPEISWEIQSEEEKRKDFILQNTIHIFDLLNYLFGEVEEFFYKGKSNSQVNEKIIHFSTINGHTGLISLTFGIPDNPSITANLPGKRLTLLPIEIFKEFEGLEMKKIGKVNKTYKPIETTTWLPQDVDTVYKAGFVMQMQEFRKFIDGDPLSIGANLSDAYKAIRLAEVVNDIY